MPSEDERKLNFESRFADAEKEFGQNYAWATSAKGIVRALINDPLSPHEEHTTSIGLRYAKLRETVKLTSLTLENRAIVAQAYGQLALIGPDQGKSASEKLFDYAKKPNSPRFPTGKVAIDSKQNPFAVTLQATQRDAPYLVDFGVAGHFISERKLRTKYGREIVFPLIVTVVEDPEVFYHESAHAWCWLIKRSFEETGQSKLWGGERKMTLDLASLLVRGVEDDWRQYKQGAKEGPIEETPSWKMIMETVLGWAKDEFLSDLIIREDISEFKVKAMKEPKRQDGHYDYPALFPWKDDYLKDYFWYKYQEIFEREVALVQGVKSTYRRLGLSMRDRILSWQLMRIPMGEWEKGLEKLGVMGEAKWINSILDFKETFFERKWGLPRKMYEALKWELRLGRVLRQDIRLLQDHQNESLLKYLAKLQNDLNPFVRELDLK